MPVAVIVRLGLPEATASGEIDVRLKVDPPPPPPVPVIVNCSASEVVVSGFMARMLIVPAVAICAAVMLAVRDVVEVTVVGRATPSHRRVVPLTKFEPVAVSVKPAPPAATVAGLSEVSVGVTTPLKPPQPETSAVNANTMRNA